MGQVGWVRREWEDLYGLLLQNCEMTWILPHCLSSLPCVLPSYTGLFLSLTIGEKGVEGSLTYTPQQLPRDRHPAQR